VLTCNRSYRLIFNFPTAYLLYI